MDAAALSARFPNVTVDPGVLYIDEGSVLTSAGIAAGIDLCLHIVRRDFGAEVANETARILEYQRARQANLNAEAFLAR